MWDEKEPDEGLKRLIDAREAGDTETLLETLRSDPAYVHVAARLLADQGEERAVPLLVDLLDADRASARLAAVRALGRLGAPPEARAPLVRIALGDALPSAREWACAALARYGDPEAAQVLLGLLGDRSRAVRLAAARALVLIGDPAFLEPILASRRSPWRHPWQWLLDRRAYHRIVASLERAQG